MYVVGRIIQFVGPAALVAAFGAGSICGAVLHHLRHCRKKREAAGRMADARGSFLVVAGYEGHTHRPIEIEVYRVEVVQELEKALAYEKRKNRELKNRHAAKLAGIRSLTR